MFRCFSINLHKIIIVCSGASSEGFTPPEDCTVIAVNNTINWLSRADYFFTLDPIFHELFNPENRREGVEYCIAFPRKFPNCTMYDRITDTSETAVHGHTGTMKGKRGLSDNGISNGNSAYGALNLAYLFGFDKLVFIGLDAGGKRHKSEKHPEHPKEYIHLKELFDSALEQVKGRVINASPKSKLGTFPKMNHQDAMEWLFS